MEETFGKYFKYIVEKKQNVTFNKASKMLDLTPAYLCDIKNDSRIPSREIQDRIVRVFNLSYHEKCKLYDLAVTRSNSGRVSVDIAEFIMENSSLRDCIREAQKNNYKDAFWNKVYNRYFAEEEK